MNFREYAQARDEGIMPLKIKMAYPTSKEEEGYYSDIKAAMEKKEKERLAQHQSKRGMKKTRITA